MASYVDNEAVVHHLSVRIQEVDVLKRFTRLLLAGALMFGLVMTTACSSTPEEPTQPTQAEQPAPAEPPAASEAPAFPGKTEEVTKLEIEDVTEGDGAEAVAGKTVTVNYTGWLTDGTQFDSSFNSGQPFVFPLGAGQVIAGWEEGVAGMKVGGTRILVIPPDKGYGEQGAGGGVIPPNATLVFQVDLLGVE